MPVYNPAIPVAPVEYEGVTYQIGLASNALLDPGLGLSTIVVGASKVTAGMLLAAAEAAAGQVDVSAPGGTAGAAGAESARIADRASTAKAPASLCTCGRRSGASQQTAAARRGLPDRRLGDHPGLVPRLPGVGG